MYPASFPCGLLHDNNYYYYYKVYYPYECVQVAQAEVFPDWGPILVSPFGRIGFQSG